MVIRSGMERILGASAAFVALACGGISDVEQRRGGPGSSSGGAGSGTGGAGNSSGGTGTIEPDCTSGDVRCSGELRELCTADGVWSETDFVCARTVAVDDETASRCVTKADGSYRCWGGEPSEALPPERYQRVQLAQQGLIGLTEDGRLLAAGSSLPPDLAPAVAFRATNMAGDQGVCPLFADGTFAIIRPPSMFATGGVTWIDGTFLRAFCAWEGLVAGVRIDGTLWLGISPWLESLPTDWRDVAMSVAILCGIRNDGSVVCLPPLYSCGMTGFSPCVGEELPVFPEGSYHSITATSGTVCVIDEAGALVCKRYDGKDMPVDAGRYTFAEGGHNTLCALRTDGTTACFQHGGNWWPTDVESFAPAEPPVDPDW